MTEQFFRTQIERLRLRFGSKAFDSEFVKILSVEVASVPDETFRRAVDVWIGSRKNNNPPLLPDFRECRLAYEKNRFTIVVDEATKVYSQNLPKILREQYKVDTLQEAIELERLKLKLGGVDGGKGKDREETSADREADRESSPFGS